VLLIGAGAAAGMWLVARRRLGPPATGIAAEATDDDTPVAWPGDRATSAPSPGSAARTAAPFPTLAPDSGIVGAQPSDASPEAASAVAVSPAAAVAALLTEIGSGGTAARDDDRRRSRDRAAFAREAALDEAGKAVVEATVDRFISAAEEVGANVAASPPANGGPSPPPAAAEMLAQLGDAYLRASEELRVLVADRGTGAPMLSLGQQLPPDVQQRLRLLSGWLPAP
jgi:hypothetical protein